MIGEPPSLTVLVTDLLRSRPRPFGLDQHAPGIDRLRRGGFETANRQRARLPITVLLNWSAPGR
jgi:hypothetical protein